jgi:hypothetical protein
MRSASRVLWAINVNKLAVIILLIDGDVQPSLEPSVDIGVGLITPDP